MVGAGSSGGWLTAPMAITLLVLATLPFWIEQVGLYQYLGVEVVIWMIYALGFNLLLGLSGLPSFGHGAYFGIGAYAFGLFQLHAFQNLWLGLGAAIAAGLVAGAFVACFISHRRGIYFALMTIAFGQVFWYTAIKWHSVTGGEDGLLDIPRPDVMSLNASGFVVMAVLIGGGLVSFWGPIIGAALFFVARDVLGAATETWVLWYGLLFMAVVLFKPEGIAGLFQEAGARRAAARPTPAPAQ